MPSGLLTAVENVLGTAMAIALVIVGRKLERRYGDLLDDDKDDHAPTDRGDRDEHDDRA